MLLIHKNNYKHIYCRKYTSWLSVYISFPYLFLIGCTGSSLLHAGFLQQRQVRPTLLVAQVAAPLTMQSQLQEAWLQQLQHMGSGVVAPEFQGSVTVTHRLSCLTAYGIFLDQRLKLCPLHWQVILNYWTTKEVPLFLSLFAIIWSVVGIMEGGLQKEIQVNMLGY